MTDLHSNGKMFCHQSGCVIEFPLHTGRKKNVHKTFRRRPERLFTSCVQEDPAIFDFFLFSEPSKAS